MRSSLLLAATFAALATPHVVYAADPTLDQCLAATETSLRLDDEHKLRAARAQLLVCSAATCPRVVREECMHRIDQLNAATPTVVFTVKTAAGDELSRVKVTMDGEVVADHLDGTALSLEPGSHVFTFEAAGQLPLVRTLLLHEGEKDRGETIIVGAVVPPPAGSAGQRSGKTMRTAAFVVGGTGVAGLALGAAFGGLAASSYSSAKSSCPSTKQCDPRAMTDRGDASTFATVSTAAFIAGGALAAAGVVLYFAAPRDKSPAVGLGVAPGGLTIGGRF